MLWYIFFPFFFFIYILFTYKYKKSGWLAVFVLLFFSIFRGVNVGTDTINYLNNIDATAIIFEIRYGFILDTGKFEFLYYLICSYIYTNNLPGKYLIYAFSIVTFLFLLLAGKRYKINIPLLCFFYVLNSMYIYSFNVSRQYAAISIMFYGTSFLQDKNWRKYLFFIWIIIGGFIHSSILICLLLYPLKYVSVNRFKISKILFYFVCFTSVVPLSDILLNLIAYINIGKYSENYGAGGVMSADDFSLFGCIYKLVTAFLFYSMFKKRKGTKYTDLFDNLFLLFFFMSGLLAYGNLGTLRFRMIFEIFACLYLTIYCFQKNRFRDFDFQIYFIVKYLLLIFISMNYHPYYLEF